MRISELTTRSAKLNTGTAYFPVDQSSDTVTNKIDYAELAKQIITEYNAQTLAGAAQSVKAALDTLDTKSLSPKTSPSTNTLDDFVTPGVYWLKGSLYTDSPFSAFGFLEVNRYINVDAAVYQRFTRYDIPDESYIRIKANNAWGAWKKHPTRAEMDAVNGRFCVTGNVTGETVQEFIANAVPLLNVPSDLKTATFSAVWANHGYVSGFIRKLRAAGGYNGMFKISSGDSESASEEYTFYSWDGVTFYANKMPTRAEMDAVSTVETITAEVNTEEVASGNFIIKKVGNVVSINGYVILANPTKTNVTITLATLPQSVRPSVAIRTTAAIAAHAYEQPEGMCYASVGTNGELSVRLQTDNLAKNNTVYMSISYII